MGGDRASRCARRCPACGIEVLPSDFKGGERDIATVLDAEPDVFAHNLETVRRLHDRIRPAFGYDRSLEVLRIAKRLRPGQVTKSNLILGMGERARRGGRRRCATSRRPGATSSRWASTCSPPRSTCPSTAGCTPTSSPPTPARARRSGIAHVEAGPLVRSSYHAGTQFQRALDRGLVRPAVGPRAGGPLEVEEPACKPDPVRGARAPPATISLGDAGTSPPDRSPARCGLPGSSDGPSSNAACSTLLRVGVASRDGRPPRWCALTAPFHPYPRDSRRARRSALCCPVREVAPAWLSPAPCPAESGLSSNGRDRPRPPGRLLHGRGYPRRRLPHDDAPHASPSSRTVRARDARARAAVDGPASPAPAPSCEARRRCCRLRCAARPSGSSRPTGPRCSAATTSKRSRRLR